MVSIAAFFTEKSVTKKVKMSQAYRKRSAGALDGNEFWGDHVSKGASDGRQTTPELKTLQ
jgi:hypothetical protein